MIPYEFNKPPDKRPSWHEVDRNERPHTPIIDVHRLLHREIEKAGWETDASEILSRGAKIRLMRALWPGTPIYKRDGWAFDFRPVMNRYVVLAGPAGIHLMYSPDKRCIREESHFHSIRKVYEIKNEVAEDYRAFRESSPGRTTRG